MGLFRRTSRKVGRVAKNVAKQVILPQDDSEKTQSSKAKDAAAQDAPQHTDAEYEALKEKYDAVMRAKWEEYYKTSCDGECENCEHYDWCPAEVEGEENPDDKVLFKGITQGDVKKAAKGSVELAREGAMAAKELKEAMDDILGGFDLKNLTK